MAETKQFYFTYKEVAEALIKQQDLHEGSWGIYVEFGIAGANIQEAGGQVLPAAIVPIVKIGLQRFETLNPLAVDAAEVNPAKKKK